MYCIYCSKYCKNNNSLTNHEIKCKENPNRRLPNIDYSKRKTSNQWSNPNFFISDETRKKLSRSSLGRKHSKETKKILADLAKKRNFGGVTQSRWIEYKGKKLGSRYELQLVKDLDKHNIKWDTCSRFEYIDLYQKRRTYTPDIYLIDYDVYLDPKNDFLINNKNPALGFSDIEKIQWVMEQNSIRVLILNKNQLSWEYIKTLL